MAHPRHAHPDTFHDGRSAYYMEEQRGRHCGGERRPGVDERTEFHRSWFRECEHWFARYYGQAGELAVCDYRYLTPLIHLIYSLILTSIVVLTTVWCELLSDPKLFRTGFVKTRDHRLIAVLALFVGGFVGRALIDQIGDAGTFGVGTGIRFLIALSWLAVPGKKRTTEKK